MKTDNTNKSNICFKTIKNMSVGERFVHPRHSSVMIKTDQTMRNISSRTSYLAVSENGLSEWISEDRYDITYLCFKKGKLPFLELSAKLKKELIKNVTYE